MENLAYLHLALAEETICPPDDSTTIGLTAPTHAIAPDRSLSDSSVAPVAHLVESKLALERAEIEAYQSYPVLYI